MPSEDPTPHPQTSRLSLPGLHPMNRFAGDGLDFRRPLSSTSTPIDETAVIDLTTDSEPIRPSFSESGSQTPIPTSHMRSTRPRFPHDIIDLADDNDDLYSTNYSPPTTDPTPQPPNRSPEIQFLSSRRLPVPQREAGPPYSLYQGRDIEDDEVEITGETRRVGVNTLPPFAHRPSTGSRATITSTGTRRPGLGVGGGYLTQALHRNGFHFAQRLLGPETRHPGPPYFQVNRVPTPLTFNGPGAMDFQTVGFSIGPNDDDEDRENAPPVTYEKPSPAPEGFTRSPKEDEVLVCPNCGDELCDGESDVKKQVWVLKACGHVSLLLDNTVVLSVLIMLFVSGLLRRMHIPTRLYETKGQGASAWQDCTEAVQDVPG